MSELAGVAGSCARSGSCHAWTPSPGLIAPDALIASA